MYYRKLNKKILYIGNKLAKHGFSLSSIETLGPLLEQEGFELLYASDKKNQILRLLSMLTGIVQNNNLKLYNNPHTACASSRIFSLRAFHTLYNPQFARKVVADLKTRHPDVTLTMVGPETDGSLEICKRLSADVGLAG